MRSDAVVLFEAAAGHHHLDGGAIRIGDDAVLLRERPR